MLLQRVAQNAWGSESTVSVLYSELLPRDCFGPRGPTRATWTSVRTPKPEGAIGTPFASPGSESQSDRRASTHGPMGNGNAGLLRHGRPPLKLFRSVLEHFA